MYSIGSQECLKNAEKLLDDAKILMVAKSFGVAQSLSVTALEEVGKAIILELADLNYVDKEIFERSMKEHLPKKVIIQTIEKGLLLPDKIDRRGGACRINKDELFSLTEKLRKDVRSLETKRQDGLYVQIRIEDGTVEKSPLNLNKNDVEQFMEVVAKSIEFGKRLCEFFNDYKSPDSKINVRNNLWMFSNKSGFSIQWDEA